MQNAMNGPRHNYLLFELIFVGPKILFYYIYILLLRLLHILFFDLQVKWAVSSPVSAGHLNSVTPRRPAPSSAQGVPGPEPESENANIVPTNHWRCSPCHRATRGGRGQEACM